MSRLIRSYVHRTLTTGGLLAGASLIAPAIASSQSISPHRAFLTQSTWAIPVDGSPRLPSSPGYSSQAPGAEGERALLGHVTGNHTELQGSRTAPVNRSAVDGERALLGGRNWFSVESK
jgi:hypothetical protein